MAVYLLSHLSCMVLAQKIFTLEIRPSPYTVHDSIVLGKLPFKKSFSSKTERDKEIQNVLFTLYDNAYLNARTDSLTYRPDTLPQAGIVHRPDSFPSGQPKNNLKDSLQKKSTKGEKEAIAYIHPGPAFKWARLKKGNVHEGILSEVGYREKLFAEKPLYFKEVRKIQEKILTYCDNNGYPFASIKLDSVSIQGDSISASLNLQKNLLVKIDSVVNRGTTKISSVYLQSYLSIRNGDLYNEALIRNIGTRIKELSFLKEKIPFRVIFPGENAKVELFLEKKRSSQFDGIVGLLPDNKTGRVLFTGDVHLKLNNSLNRGELFELTWRRLQVSTQDLKTQVVLPFLFKTPFGIDADFKLYKKDSTYLEVNPTIGIQYHLSGENYFKAFVNRTQMTLLNTKSLQYVTVLPPYADITSSLYGLSIKSEKLDYRLNPRKGYSLLGTIGAGNKTIRKNDKLEATVYDGLNLNSVQYNAQLEADFYVPVKNRSALKLGTRSAYLQNENLFQNELFRLGGLKTLRGFDEESILASSYYIFSVEYHYILEENSYLYVFGDGAYYENRSISYTGRRYDTPYGFGAGISFETKAGIFSINYALGSQFHNPIDLRTGKVHFGIVNYF
jgi:outer membrane protein assembly factor BamA